MRKVQWTGAVIVLAVLVFALTFAMNFTPSKRTPPPAPAKAVEITRLWFVNEVAGKDVPIPPTEVSHNGSWDYWFDNRNPATVQVGLAEKRPPCCLENIELFQLQDYKRAELVAENVGRLARLGSSGALATVTSGVAGELLVQKNVEGVDLKEDKGVAVPSRSLGWIRVNWNARNAETLSYEVNLWVDSRVNPSRPLAGKLLVVQPVMIRAEGTAVGVLGDQELPKKIPVYFYSTTRDHLDLKIVVDHDRYRPSSDPFQVSAPERLTWAQLLERDETKAAADLPCVYRVWVTLGHLSPDKSTPFDLGVFERSFTVSCAGEPGTEQTVTVNGKVEGEVTLGSTNGIAQFGPFRASTGTRLTYTLESDVPGLELQVDQSRMPPFLETPKLLKKEGTANHQVWNLVLRIPPERANGRFPDPKVESLRDSAVYVKTIYPKGSGKVSRMIRIPLEGVANN